ncbi:MAG TPA: ComEC/Rec2 family competence protein [Gillisia sp.]|nr:ComEC/Rec2 family competence protein [Gillisia sp.]
MLNFTIIKLALCVMLGVMLGFYLELPVNLLFVPFIILLAGFLFAYFRSRRLFLQDMAFGIPVYLLFIFFGITTTTLQNPRNIPSHYIHLLQDKTEVSMVTGDISEKLKPGLFHDKYILSVKEINKLPVTGKILLNITRDTLTASYEVGQKLVVAGEIRNINSPLNPYQFDYRRHMEKLGVHGQMNSDPEEVLTLAGRTNGIRDVAGNIREGIISRLRTHDFGPDELAIIQALLLGQRQEISQEIYSNYAAAGVIHILAVSGLHVGIILLLLNQLLKPLERVRFGRILKMLGLLVLLWGFALLAGLSPSVVRAVSMFSFVAIGMQLKRRTSVLNTLFMSLMILLLINPGFLLQVGFQLSYAAVFSIVLIQPHIYKVYKGESKIIRYFWGILSVTIAAQLGVLPLSLFYFNQFPGLFFISNLVILPFLGLILGLGILVLLLARLDLLPAILADLFGWMIGTLNDFVSWAASNEKFIFENIGFSLLLCLVSYLMVIAFINLLKTPRPRSIVLLLGSVITFQLALFYEKYISVPEEFVVFHKSRNTVLAEKRNDLLSLHHDLEEPPPSYSFIKDYSTHRNINLIESGPLVNIIDWRSRRILRIDNNGIYDIPGLSPNIILVTNSPQINMERLLGVHSPKVIIADGSNYPSFIKQWRKTAEENGIRFHATGTDGAFIMSESNQTLID